jgi:type I restriction enzyme M protein
MVDAACSLYLGAIEEHRPATKNRKLLESLILVILARSETISIQSESQAPNNLVAYIWSLATFCVAISSKAKTGRIILPFTLLRRLECVLESGKDKALAEYGGIKQKNLPEEGEEKLLPRATDGIAFFNSSKMDLSKLDEAGIKANLDSYIQSFSKDAREIFEYFKFGEFIGELNDANLLCKVVQKVRQMDLSPEAVSTHDMGLVFEIVKQMLCLPSKKADCGR